MVRLSVNVNKVATLRNARGGAIPSVIDAVQVCIDAGSPGITVHPRADARHITFADVHAIAATLAPLRGRVEFNIEGDPRPDLIALVREVHPDQCTLVPVLPGEITSQAGWQPGAQSEQVPSVVRDLRARGPDAAGVTGTDRLLELVRHADERTLILCLLSGGGSALLVAPLPGITLED